MKKITYKVAPETPQERLDIYISSKGNLSRSYVQKLLKEGLILVNSNPQKASYKIREGDLIEVTLPPPPSLTLTPENIPLNVLYEDEHIIVINKPPGMVVYPSAGHKTGTLLNALTSRCKRLASIGAPLRAGFVHRLDKDTSGIIVIAKDDESYINLSKQFKERSVEKHYLALLYGNLKKDRGEISASIGRAISDRKKMSTKTRKGKEAITQFEVMRRFKLATLTKVKIITGRTHQIRVHFASIGHPVLGDKTYGKKVEVKVEAKKKILFNRQMLHAYSLRFNHPIEEGLLQFTAPMPDDMKKAIEELTDLS